ncbi:MAG: peptidase [Gemmatimonadetes bacterium]|jgi:aminopeptidase YwaD|nr:peptidase [Gemmatimonadota bacterium]
MRLALRLAALTLLASACRHAPAGELSPDTRAARLLADIAYLADDRLEGRGTGTAGNDSAAAWLARRHAALGLRPLATDTARPGCLATPAPASCRSFLQRFTARGAELSHAGRPEGVPTQNVIALVPGRDPALAGEVVVIGAHFDHLGRSPASAMDPEAKDAIRNGADDNASGTAAALELARTFAARPARRSILIAHFTGEELGLLGSQWLVEHSPVATDSITAMINFDMVGRLRADHLIVYGTGTAAELPGILERANDGTGLRLSSVADGFGPSDHSSFYAKGIPVLHFFTDLHDDYHRATDDVERINVEGEARIVALAERVVRSIADAPARLTVRRAEAPVASMSAGQGSSVYLGTIPDMSAGDAPGLRLTGVRAGSPADVAGLRAGDVIVVLGGVAVKDLYSYSSALYAHQPGEKVSIGFLRAGQPHAVTVTLGRRGG